MVVDIRATLYGNVNKAITQVDTMTKMKALENGFKLFFIAIPIVFLLLICALLIMFFGSKFGIWENMNML